MRTQAPCPAGPHPSSASAWARGGPCPRRPRWGRREPFHVGPGWGAARPGLLSAGVQPAALGPSVRSLAWRPLGSGGGAEGPLGAPRSRGGSSSWTPRAADEPGRGRWPSSLGGERAAARGPRLGRAPLSGGTAGRRRGWGPSESGEPGVTGRLAPGWPGSCDRAVRDAVASCTSPECCSMHALSRFDPHLGSRGVWVTFDAHLRRTGRRPRLSFVYQCTPESGGVRTGTVTA